MSADKLEAMSDSELLAYFEKEGFLNITRPDRITKIETKKSTANGISAIDKRKNLMKIAEQYGLDLEL